MPILRKIGLDHADSPIFLQSFEAGNLRTLNDQFKLRVRKVFLTRTSGTPFNDRAPTPTSSRPPG